MEVRDQQDQHGDDRQIPEQRRDRKGAEAVVAVEDPNHDTAHPEHDQDREEDLGEGDGEIEDLPFEAGREEWHDHRREEDEQRRNRTQHEGDQEQQGRGEPEGLAVVLFLQLLGEDGDEGRLQRRIGEEGANQVWDLEGDREGRHRTADAVVAGGDDLADEACDPRGSGGEGEERRGAGDASGTRAGSRLAGAFLAGLESLRSPQRGVGGDRCPLAIVSLRWRKFLQAGSQSL